LTGIINTATTNGSGLGDGIATLAKTHGFTITSDEVYAHQDFLGQDDGLTDFELQLISGGQNGGEVFVNPIHPNRLTQTSA
jgi:hypothetical protein